MQVQHCEDVTCLIACVCIRSKDDKTTIMVHRNDELSVLNDMACRRLKPSRNESTNMHAAELTACQPGEGNEIRCSLVKAQGSFKHTNVNIMTER